MPSLSWLFRFAHVFTRAFTPRKNRSKFRWDAIDRLHSLRLRLDQLEDRTVPAVVTVTGTGDAVAVDGLVTLREALLSANANADQNADVTANRTGTYGADTIAFNIAGAGPHTISPTSAWPDITDTVTIDGFTQSGASANTQATGNDAVYRIVLSGASAGAGVAGLTFQFGSDNSVLRGLVVNQFTDYQVVVFTDGTTVAGNFIGTNATGTAVAAGTGGGLLVFGADGATVGGATAADRNLIAIGSGTSWGMLLNLDSNTTVRNNYVGTNAAGTAGLGNVEGVTLSGATAATIRDNVISGNAQAAIGLSATSTATILGNRLGTNAAGTAVIGNSRGIGVESDSVATIGDGTAAGRNVISGNSAHGIYIDSGKTGTTIRGNYIGTNAAGDAALGNGGGFVDSAGILLTGSFFGGAQGVVIGGTTAGERNVISGNDYNGVRITGTAFTSAGNAIRGNYIGLAADGVTALGNGTTGVKVDGKVTGTTIGGLTATPGTGAGNVISGNLENGIQLEADGQTVLGNVIGLDKDGDADRGNTIAGVDVRAAATIGGANPQARNVISGNQGGIDLTTTGAAGTVILNNYIGTDITGALDRGNTLTGIFSVASNVTIGQAGAGNVISGNNTIGVQLSGVQGAAKNVTIRGNSIGTNAAGTAAIGNLEGVVFVSGASNNTLGGANTTAVQEVTITGSTGGYILLFDGFGTGVLSPGAPASQVQSELNALSSIGGVGGSVTVSLVGNVYTVTFGGTLQYTVLPTIQFSLVGGSVSGSVNVVSQGAFAGNLISGNTGVGVAISGGTTTGNTVSGNWIGLTAAGAALGNGGEGIDLNGDAGGNTIGGATAAHRNVISGNVFDGIGLFTGANTNVIRNNFIGTNPAGTAAVANGGNGITVNGAGLGGAFDNQILDNVISGNSFEGVILFGAGATNNTVAGNRIGTNAAGTAAIGNAATGVTVTGSATGNYIGTDGDGVNDGNERNVISGNTQYGVFISGANGNRVAGNLIGLNAAGTAAVPNQDGIYVTGSTGNVIGTDGSNDAFNANEKNVISGNTDRGVILEGANVVAGNWIGLKLDGTAAGNKYGIQVTETGGRVGTNADGIADADERNVISGNTISGIIVRNSSTTGAVIAGNYIGTDPTGLLARPNNVGIDIVLGANGITVGGFTTSPGTGAGNVIGGNASTNVNITGAANNTFIRGNLIGLGADGGTDLGSGIGITVAATNNPLTPVVIGGDDDDDGTADGTVQARNVISGLGTGINLSTSGSNIGTRIQGNYVGLNRAGTAAIGNSTGVAVGNAPGTLVGGTTAGAGNVISGNTSVGVVVNSTNGSATIQGNLIGTNPAGTAAIGNGIGVNIANANNTVGGTTVAARNVISGNTTGVTITGVAATGNTIAGNYVGTDVTGTAKIANTQDGVVVTTGASGNTVGGTGAGEGNLISGNSRAGVYLAGVSSNTVLGNLIGTKAGGTAALGNSSYGVFINSGSSNNTIGGSTTAARNIISGNGFGIEIDDSGGASDNNVIRGNYIGTNITGTAKIANGTGIQVQGVALAQGAAGNQIGGPGAGDGNLISGNTNFGVILTGPGAKTTTIAGNYIGTTVGGTAALANDTGVQIQLGADDNTVGGTTGAIGALGTAAFAGNVISGNTNFGVQITDNGTTGNTVAGNYIGTDRTGMADLGNTRDGVLITDKASGNTIGGTTAAARNVISGNNEQGVTIRESGTTGNVVAGNYIGLAQDGATPLGNTLDGISINISASGNTIGGAVAGAGNVISGNLSDGIVILGSATGNTVAGNFIGTNALGTAAVANAAYGVFIHGGAASNTVGGTTGTIGALGTAAFAGNVISGNTGDGVVISGSTSTGNLVQGNYVGTNAAGTAALANANGILLSVTGGNTVGGTAAGAGNLISGNTTYGVWVSGGTAAGNTIQGNRVGLNAAGTAAVGNVTGVRVDNAPNTRVGGPTATAGTGAGNVIAGNSAGGVSIVGASATGTTVEGNVIGLGPDGSTAFAGTQTQYGVQIATAATGVTVGGTAATARNVISGSFYGVRLSSAAAANTVAGNYIGTDIGGTLARGNTAAGVLIESGGTNNTVGGTAAGAGNLISGNNSYGVWITDSGTMNNVVQGNFIGTNAAGTGKVANTSDGVRVEGGAANNTIGGTTGAIGALGTAAFAGNVISGNTGDGIEVNAEAILSGTVSWWRADGTTADVVGGNTGTLVGGAGYTNSTGGVDAQAFSFDGVNDGVLIGNPANLRLTGSLSLDAWVYTADLAEGQVASVITKWGQSVTLDSYALSIRKNTGSIQLIGSVGDGASADTGLAGGTIAVNTWTHVAMTYDATTGANKLYVNGVEVATRTRAGGTFTSNVDVYIGREASFGGERYFTGRIDAPAIYNRALTAAEIATIFDIGGIAKGRTVIQGNRVGLGATGGVVANSSAGVRLTNALGNLIGGPTTAARNVVSGNTGNGIELVNANRNVIRNNYVGTDVNGTAAAGNLGAAGGVVLTSTARNNVVRDNVVSANATGVYMSGGAAFNELYGNLIGTDKTGLAPLGNTADGVRITTSAGANTVGGTTAADRNVISGNTGIGVLIDAISANGNVVQGNYIGLDFNGTAKLSNTVGVRISGAVNNTIGGTTAGARNVISGNFSPTAGVGHGVHITGTGADNNVVAGNYIGTDFTGLLPVGNSSSGVQVNGGARFNIIGGSVVAARNVIAGNAPTNNGNGIGLSGAGTGNNQVLGNYIGLGSDGSTVMNTGFAGIRMNGGSNNVIGGNTPTPGTGPGNVISGTTYGVFIDNVGATGNVVRGNLIGTDATGTAARGNVNDGVRIATGASNNTIGGSTAGDGNVISGNTQRGVYITGSGSTGNTVRGNYVGTTASGNAALGNGSDGVRIDSAANNNLVRDNVLSGNANDGLNIFAADGTQVHGNIVGLGADGSTVVGNGAAGIEVQGNTTTIGTGLAADRNVLSGNVTGFSLTGNNNTARGNYVGTDATGLLARGNTTQGAFIGGTGNVVDGGVFAANTQHQIHINTATNAQITGNLLGLNVAGASLGGGTTAGVFVTGTGTGNTIGGTTAAARNVISGNNAGVRLQSDDVTIQGNYIGTTIDGTGAVPNTEGIRLDGGSANNTIGGTAAGAGNVVSGNAQYGIRIDGVGTTGNVVAGNYIGTKASGSSALGNGESGVLLNNASNNTIGGTTAGAGNVISGNGVAGISLGNGVVTGNTIAGNIIGLNAAGNAALGNVGYGINASSEAVGNLIGGVTAGARNVISGNLGYGILLNGQPGTGNTVQGNYIGTDATGTVAFGNTGTGVALANGSSGNTIGGTQYGQAQLSGQGQLGYAGGMAVGAGGVIFVADARDGLIGGDIGGVVRIDPVTGAQTTVTAGGLLDDATDLLVEPGGDIIALDLARGVVRVNPTSGVQTFVSDFANGLLGPAAPFAYGLAREADGNFIVSDFDNNRVLRVNAATGVRTVVSTGGNLNTPNGVAVEADGSILVTCFTPGTLVRINPTTGAQAVLATGLGSSISVDIMATGEIVVNDAGSQPGGNPADGRVLAIDRVTGAVTTVGSGGLLRNPSGITVEANGTLVVSDVGDNAGDPSRLLRLTPGGAGNVIAHSGDRGLYIDGGVGNTLRSNRVFANTGAQIQLVNNANANQAAPVVTGALAGTLGGATRVIGSVAGFLPSATYALDFFSASVPTEARRFLGSGTVTTNAAGAAAFDIGLPVPLVLGDQVTATATHLATGNSSGLGGGVAATAAIITGLPAQVNEGTPVTLTAFTAADPGGGQSLSFNWVVRKNGNPYAVSSEASITFTPDDEGPYSVALTVGSTSGVTATVGPVAFAVLNAAPAVQLFGAPSGVTVGTPVNLSAVANDPGAADVLTYTWQVNGVAQPNPLNLPTFTFTPTAGGLYEVGVTVSDGELPVPGTDTRSTVIAVTGGAVAVTLDGPAAANEGTPVRIVANVSDLPRTDSLVYAWVVQKAGAAYPFTRADEGVITFTPNDNAAYTVRLTVTSDGITYGPFAKTVAVANVNPEAAIVGVPAVPNAGQAITVSGVVTDRGPADVHTYQWELVGPAAVPGGTGATFTFTPPVAGGYVLKLTVRDDDGGLTTVARDLDVSAAGLAVAITGAPAAALEGPAIGLGSTIGSPGAATFRYEWVVTRDGVPFGGASSAGFTAVPLPFTLTPTDDGDYVVTLTVTASDGRVGSATRAIGVSNQNPTASIGVSGVLSEGSPITLTAAATDPASEDVLRYEWRVNSVLQPNGPDPTRFVFVPPDNGSFVIGLTVFDDDGGSVTKFQTLAVGNVAPTAKITSDPAATTGTAVGLAADVRDPGFADTTPNTFTYAWAATKNGATIGTLAGTGAAFSKFTYSTAGGGTFVVTLSVTDKDGSAAPPVTTLSIVGDGANNTFAITPALIASAQTASGKTLTQILVQTLGGDDVVTTDPAVMIPVVIDGGAGNDQLGGGSGNDLLIGGPGNNTLSGGGGADTLRGGGNDDLSGGFGDDNYEVHFSTVRLFEAGAGIDTIDLTAAQQGVTFNLSVQDGTAQTVFAGSTLAITGPFEVLKGSNFGDNLTTRTSSTTVFGGLGDDSLTAAAGVNITVFGGEGNDSLVAAGASEVTVFGGDGNDTLAVTGGSDVTVFGDGGDDSLAVAAGASITVFGGDGNDTLAVGGAAGNVTVFGGDGGDRIVVNGATGVAVVGSSGGPVVGGQITLFGSAADDDSIAVAAGASITVFGGDGNDTLAVTGGVGVTVFGGDGNDSLAVGGTAGNVTVFGDGGDDSIVVAAGANITVFGGDGNDTLAVGGTAGEVTVFGGDGNDSLAVLGGTDVTVFGGEGNDSLAVLGGTDVTVFGDGGDDSLAVAAGTNVTVFGGDGNDTLAVVNGTNVTVFGNGDDDTISVLGGANVTVFGGDGDDSLAVTAGTNVTVFGGDGEDSLAVAAGTNVTVFGDGGDDTLAVTGGANVTVFGGDGDDSLTVAAGTDVTVFGNGDDDTLAVTGGTSVTVFGGDGDDSLVVAGGTNVTVFGNGDDDTIVVGGAAAQVTVFGGDGNDSLAVAGGTDVTVFGDGGDDTLAVAGGTNVTVFGADGEDTLAVTGGTNVTVFGGDGNDSIAVAGGTDVTVFGGEGNDSLAVAAGTDVTVFGSEGDDTLAVTGGTNVTVFGGDGNDTLGVSGGTHVTVLGGVGDDSIVATGGLDVTVYGGVGNDRITVADDADTLSVAGHVTVFGGEGNDSLVVAAGTDVTVFGNGGDDTLAVTGGTDVTVFGGDGNDSIAVAGGTDVTVFGDGGDDTLAVAGGTHVTVFGGDGNDSLTVAGGTEVTVFGGFGNDTLCATGGLAVKLYGEVGNDFLCVGAGPAVNVTVAGGSGNDSLIAAGGVGVVLLGEAGADTLSAADVGAVTLSGGRGDDLLVATRVTDVFLFGDDGNDTYRFGAAGPQSVRVKEILALDLSNFEKPTLTANDPVKGEELEARGSDTLDLSAYLGVTVSLATFGSEIDPAVGRQAVSLAGGFALTIFGSFENVIGTALADTITGNAAANLLVGGGGNDVIDGQAGDDTIEGGAGDDALAGGTGNDTYVFDGLALGADTVVEADNAADDTLDFSQFASALSLNLGSTAPQAFGSNLVLTLSSDSGLENVIGTTQADAITGNTRDNLFEGGAGNDTLAGGAGSDTYVFAGTQLGADTVTEADDADSDTLDFSQLDAPLTLDLGAAGPQVFDTALTLTLFSPLGRGVENAVGTGFGDTILGNARENFLYGAGGADSLDGGAGNDRLQGDIMQVVLLDFDSSTNPLAGDWQYTPAERAAILANLQADFAPFNYVFTTDPAAARNLTATTGRGFVTIVYNDGPGGGIGGEANELDFRNLDRSNTSTVDVNDLLGGAGQPAKDGPNVVGLTTTVTAHELGHMAGLRHADAFGPIGSGIFAGANPNRYIPVYTGPTGATETPRHIMASPLSVGTTLFDATADTFFGQRETIKLAFAETGITVRERTTAAGAHGTFGTAEPLGVLPGLNVPNSVGALAVVGEIKLDGATGKSEDDVYSFVGKMNDIMSFEVVAGSFSPLRGNPIDGIVRVYDSAGTLMAWNDDDLETTDPNLIDVVLPADGVYYVTVDTFATQTTDLDVGRYELYMTRFRVGPSAETLGDTIAGGAGNDSVIGSAADDIFRATGTISGDADEYFGKAGFDTLDLTGFPGLMYMANSVEKVVAANTAPTLDTVPPVTVNQGTVVQITPSATDIDVGDRKAFTLTPTGVPGDVFPDGASVDPRTGLITWAADLVPGNPTVPQTFKATLTVRDLAGVSASQVVTITVNNVAPVLAVGGTANLTEGGTLTRTGSFTDPGSDAWTATVDYGDGTGVQPLALNPDKTFTLSHPYPDDGTFTVTVTVGDGFASVSKTFSAVVAGVAPTGTLSNSGPVTEGSTATVTFTTVADDSPVDAASLTYSFDFNNDNDFLDAGEVQNAAGPTATVPASYLADGPFGRVVRGRITDKDGKFTDYTTTIAVENKAPTASASVTTAGTLYEGSPVSFAGTASDPGNDIASRAWSAVGSNGQVATGSGSMFTFTPVADGTYTVRFTATDTAGAAGEAVVQITVRAIPRGVLANSGPVAEGGAATVTLTPTNLSPAEAALLRYSFDFDNNGTWDSGNGTYAGSVAAATAAVPPALLANGPASRTVKVRVVNGDDKSTDYTTTITVTNAAPAVTIPPLTPGGSVNLTLDESAPSFTRTGSFADPGADSWTAQVNYGDTPTWTPLTLNPDKSFTLNYTYADSGNYTVTVKVADGTDTGTMSFVAAVANKAPTATFTGPAAVTEGSATTTVSFSAQTDPSTPDKNALRYAYDFDSDGTFEVGDGTYVGSAIGSSAAVVPASYLADGLVPAAGRKVTARVIDKDGGYTDYETTITVNNAAPTAAVTGPANPMVSVPANYTFTAADPSPVDQAAKFTFEIDWNGDGIYDKTVTDFSGVVVSNTFATAGPTTVKVRATDKDGTTGPVTSYPIVVGGTSTAKIYGGDLYAFGTSGNDTITVSRTGGGYRVQINATTIGLGTPTGKIVVYGYDGNDTISVNSNITLRTELYGGGGNDTITGGWGNDTIDGGAGNDSLVAVVGDDVLTGGEGNDSLNGGSGLDSLDGGAGDDSLDGGSGTDTMAGGTGYRDILLGGDGDDRMSDVDGVLQVDGGSGNDAIDLTFAAGWTVGGATPLRLALGALTGGSGDDSLVVAVNNAGVELDLKGDSGQDYFELKGYWKTIRVYGDSGTDTLKSRPVASPPPPPVAPNTVVKDSIEIEI